MHIWHQNSLTSFEKKKKRLLRSDLEGQLVLEEGVDCGGNIFVPGQIDVIDVNANGVNHISSFSLLLHFRKKNISYDE